MILSSNFFNVALFLLPSLVTVPSFMSIPPLVLELWQFSFIRDWPEMRKLEIPSSEIWPISGDRGKLGILDCGQMSLTKCQNVTECFKMPVLQLYHFWVIKRKTTVGRVKLLPPPRLGLTFFTKTRNFQSMSIEKDLQLGLYQLQTF